ncbi:MAG: sigma-70 family RNA polymerase sigma factor [Phycisphaerales bacterium]|nr:sigma-70 family RNA polymerase sigma factor [Phycisphaerales bacterium]MCB9857633.1 sigma-70 family RNA polymerase sigma factor [Phycisphaerales bacterium]MCB9864810.1 sigma-70 family RNA polymerase sigma factor [Phycisphaerales bacterium]
MRPIVRSSGDSADVCETAEREAELIALVRAGDTAAYAELVRTYQDRVFGLCFRMCRNASDAEDLAQEAFVRAYHSLASFDGRARFYTWLFRIAVNVSISERRRAARRPLRLATDLAGSDGTDNSAAGMLQQDEDCGPRAEDHAMRKEQTEIVLAALAELDEEQRCIVTLRDMQSLGYDEIAEVMDIPIGTVKSRLHRARLALRRRLSPLFD